MDLGAGEDATDDVFQNKVVLREIFKYLPTSSLLSSCSLVNRLWRNEARSFIRDHRECEVKLGVRISARIEEPTNLWKQLCKLDRVLGEMDTIPFNSIRGLVTFMTTLSDEEDADVNDLTNLMSRFPLKYLTVFEDGGIARCPILTCPAVSAILELVRKNSSTLLELDSRSIGAGNFELFKDWEPPQRFDKLRKLSITKYSSITSDCAKKMIRGAPNLSSIQNSCLHMIPDVIPENMYGTLKRLSFRPEDVHRIEKLAGKLDHVEELVVDLEGSHKSAVGIRCVALFRKLLALNTSTLCSLDIGCDQDLTLFNQLQLPQLPSVKVLSISVWSTFGIGAHISALNFRASLPNLRQVHIREKNEVSVDRDDPDAGIIPEEDAIVAPNPSETTMELTVDGSLSTLDLATLGRLFPNVTIIKFSLSRHPLTRQLPPLGLIGIMWPNLQSLGYYKGIYSRTSSQIFEKQVGSQVFGLNPEEWELLRRQDEDFLKRVQLVPSRPCLLTMRELKHFQMEYGSLSYSYREHEAFPQLLETLAIGRMSGLSLKVEQVRIHPSWRKPRFNYLGEEYGL